MSSTHSHEKLVAAFEANNGETYYIGYEKSCSSNTFPREPTWYCYFVGNATDSLKAIFNAASQIPGGMLKGPGGRSLKPENYIAAWLREMANPVRALDLNVCLREGGQWHYEWCKGSFDSIQKKLTAIGTPKAMELLRCAKAGETTSLQLDEDIDLFLAMYGVDEERGAGSVIKNGERQARAERVPALGYAPRKIKPSTSLLPPIISLGETFPEYLAMDGGGVWRSLGRQSCAMRSFINSLVDHEVREPGSYRKHIAAYRDALDAAPVLSEICTELEVIVDTSAELAWNEKANLESLLKEVPHAIEEGQVRIKLTFPGVHYSLIGYIPTEHSHWLLPKDIVDGDIAQAAQLSLIA